MSLGSELDATRAAYDAVAVDYARLLDSELADRPLDRALLTAFAAEVAGAGGGPVVDAGCGPGRLTGHLVAAGLDVFGVDLSPGMVAEARRRHPRVRFVEGRLDALAVPAGSLAGVLAWYSIIHTSLAELDRVFSEFARVLRPGGPVLLAFQVGDERVARDRAYGHPVALVNHRLPVEGVVGRLEAAGLRVEWRVVREPGLRERAPQAYLFARRS